MINKMRVRGTFLCIIILVIPPVLIAPSILLAEVTDGSSSTNSATTFILTIQDNLISLKAKEAPVLEIVKEIGRRMEIEVAGDIPAMKTVSLEFEKLTFDEALARLQVDYVYLTGSGESGNRIMKVTLLPKGEGDGGPMVASQSASGRTVGSASKPAGGDEARKMLQRDSGKTSDRSEPSPEPFKFEFNP